MTRVTAVMVLALSPLLFAMITTLAQPTLAIPTLETASSLLLIVTIITTVR